MSDFNALKETIKQLVENVIDGRVPGGCTRATLISLDPLEFQITSKLKIYGQFLVTPRHKKFRAEDIGKEYVFFKDGGGQTYYWLYEAMCPQGDNGVPYHWSGEMVSCALQGLCSCGGTVLVTHGEVYDQEHYEQVGNAGSTSTGRQTNQGGAEK